MRARRPRLPMLLGLAALTVAAHALIAAFHLGFHPLPEWPLLVLLAAAPLAALALMLRGRPRHGAALLALTMGVAAFWTLYAHYVAGTGPRTHLAAWTLQLLLAFELQGLALGALLVVKPETPRAQGPALG